MSYCRINIGGKERGLKFNQLAWLIFNEKIDRGHVLQTAAYALVYAGLKANCYVKSEEADFDFEKVCEWVESVSDEDLEKVNNAFQETQFYKNSEAYKKEQEGSKKKSAMRNTKGNALK